MEKYWFGLIIISCILHNCYAVPKSSIVDSGFDISKKINELLKSGPNLTEAISKIDEAEFMKQYKAGENNPDKYLNLTQLVTKYGYNVTTYHVTTEDGYIIAAYNIPGNGEPVLIVHGIMMSAIDWLTVGPEQGLPYLLAERGHDVWLLDKRGSTPEARGHVSLSADSNPDQYWDFSWDEIGRYDIAAAIDFILQKTDHETLKYVGHSQGNTAFLVLMSERPEYNRKVSSAVTLSPVSFMAHIKSPLFRLMSPTADWFRDFVVGRLHINAFDVDNPIVSLGNEAICGNTLLAKTLCSSVMFVNAGFDYPQMNVTNLPNVFVHMLGSSSMKQFIHYGQGINSGKFRRFDFGPLKNLEKYGSLSPPEYPLEKITVPLAIFYTDDNDWLCAKKDVETLLKGLKKETVHSTYIVPLADFCHMDYLWAKDVKKLVYDKVLEIFKA